jgi:hypothetical protein
MLAIQETTISRRAPRARPERFYRPARSRRLPRGPEPETGQIDNPTIVTVFMKPSGTIYHTRCRQPLAYQGMRGRIEVDFYCLRCIEHVSLPIIVIPRIPMEPVEPGGTLASAGRDRTGWPPMSAGGSSG